MKRLKEYLGSINLTLFLIACCIGAWKGIDPCENVVVHFLDMAGIEYVKKDVTSEVPVGPPMVIDREIKLDDGRVIYVLANGSVSILEKK